MASGEARCQRRGLFHLTTIFEEAMNKEVIQTALIAIAAFAVVAAVQKHVFAVPGVGAYLPKAA